MIDFGLKNGVAYSCNTKKKQCIADNNLSWNEIIWS